MFVYLPPLRLSGERPAAQDVQAALRVGRKQATARRRFKWAEEQKIMDAMKRAGLDVAEAKRQQAESDKEKRRQLTEQWNAEELAAAKSLFTPKPKAQPHQP
jgi:hypothetical protein